MVIMGIAAEDISQWDKCNVGGSCESLPLITLATDITTYCHALCDALYGDFITVRCTDNNYN